MCFICVCLFVQLCGLCATVQENGRAGSTSHSFRSCLRLKLHTQRNPTSYKNTHIHTPVHTPYWGQTQIVWSFKHCSSSLRFDRLTSPSDSDIYLWYTLFSKKIKTVALGGQRFLEPCRWPVSESHPAQPHSDGPVFNASSYDVTRRIKSTTNLISPNAINSILETSIISLFSGRRLSVLSAFL